MVFIKSKAKKNKIPKPILYRFAQLVAFLIGARFFVVAILAFALYVSTFFLFNQEESLRNFVFDFKIHGIIFCSLLSILAGGIINQFYDREKDRVIKPFRSRIQNFLQQKYFLYVYISLNVISLTIAGMISWRFLVYLLLYQFALWFYSHRLSKILIINNLTFVAITLYPFFGMLVYYRTISSKIMLMALFLFLVILLIDILKDMLTKNADKVFGYHTIPNTFGYTISRYILLTLFIVLYLISGLLVYAKGLNNWMGFYFGASLFIISCCIYILLKPFKNSNFIIINFLRFWLFVGIISMLCDGIFNKM